MTYSLVMDTFTLLVIEGAINGKMKPKMPNLAVEITRGCRLNWDEMFARNIIERNQVGRTFVLCSRCEYNTYAKLTRRIISTSEIY